MTPFGEDRGGKELGEGTGEIEETVGAVGPMHNYKDPEMEHQKQDMRKDQPPPPSPRPEQHEATARELRRLPARDCSHRDHRGAHTDNQPSPE